MRNTSAVPGLTGWDRLRHGGLLLDPDRLRRIAAFSPGPLAPYTERELRRQAAAVLDGGGDLPDFVTFVLGLVCGFAKAGGTWQRGSQIPTEWGRRAVTGETIKPRQLWRGPNGAIVPVFLDDEKRLGIGRGSKATSQTVQWLRASDERLGVLTNGRQWRLIFAGLDFNAWCEWDVDLWLEEGALGPQVQALRTLLSPAVWTPAAPGTPSPLLGAIQDSRKGQSELSAVLGERVREAVELLVQSHGEVLKEQCAGVDPAEIYRAAARMVMRMVVVLFAETRELLPRDNALYHGSYGLTGLLEELEKVAGEAGIGWPDRGTPGRGCWRSSGWSMRDRTIRSFWCRRTAASSLRRECRRRASLRRECLRREIPRRPTGCSGPWRSSRQPALTARSSPTATSTGCWSGSPAPR
jgi:hypothetical protein